MPFLWPLRATPHPPYTPSEPPSWNGALLMEELFSQDGPDSDYASVWFLNGVPFVDRESWGAAIFGSKAAFLAAVQRFQTGLKGY